MVAAYETRDAFRVNATVSDTPTGRHEAQDRDHAKGRAGRCAAGRYGLAEHHPPGGGEHAGHEHGGADPDDETLRWSTAAANSTIRTAMAHQYQLGMTASRMTCSRRRPISVRRGRPPCSGWHHDWVGELRSRVLAIASYGLRRVSG